MTADPSYPLFPVASILCSALLLLVLTTSFIRQSWNLGVASLCFWLLLENLTDGVNAIMWSDNADIKAEIYCDIVIHLQIFTSILKPACSLVITRRLHNIAKMRSVDMENLSRGAKCMDRLVDIFLVLILPALITGAYYIVQSVRFQVVEGFGCEGPFNFDGVAIILIGSWPLILPLISVFFYIPKIMWTFLRLKRETSQFLDSSGSLSRRFYYRILSIGCLDILFTLPFGISNIVIDIRNILLVQGRLPFYWGFSQDHTGWSPVSISYTEMRSQGVWNVADQYLQNWISVVLGFVIFGFFGLTGEARAMYWSWVYRVAVQSPINKSSHLSDLAFRTRELILDAEQGPQPSLVNSSIGDQWKDRTRDTMSHFEDRITSLLVQMNHRDEYAAEDVSEKDT